jgi:hypothetical protein
MDGYYDDNRINFNKLALSYQNGVPFKRGWNYKSQLFFSFKTFIAKVQIIELSKFSSIQIKFVYHLV